MAETFEAVRVGANGFEQRVCLKRVLPAFGADGAFVSRFQREARLAARLRHTNVVGVVDFGAESSVHYMALELVDGRDLRTFLSTQPERKVPSDLVTLIAADVAMALAYAHAPAPPAAPSGIVHRDVSPSNILLGRTGEVKLADFGIAQALGTDAATASGEVRGKIPYMSPEQMRGAAVDGRADLFSLGVVMFEMLAGVRPFDGAHDVETMTHILTDERRSLSDHTKGVPASLLTVVERLLESRPENRYQSAEELLEALEEVGVDARVRRRLSANMEASVGGVATREHLGASAAGNDIAVAIDDFEASPDASDLLPQPLARALSTIEGSCPATEAALGEASPTRPHGRANSATADPLTVTELAPLSRRSSAAVQAKQATNAHPSSTTPRWSASPGAMALGSIALSATGLCIGLWWGQLSSLAAPSAPTSAGAGARAHDAQHAPPAFDTTLPSDAALRSPAEPIASRTASPPVGVAEASNRTASLQAAARGTNQTASLQAQISRPSAAARPAPASSEPSEAPEPPGRLRVTVVPWGHVWIDRRRVGRAPRSLTLEPGMHLVQVGVDSPIISRHVLVRSGRTVELDLDLERE